MTPTITPEVREFATAVRSRLRDLPDETVDELTEGLEADLAERLATDGGELGDPSEYAAELRAAAGLPSGGRAWGTDDRFALAIRDFLLSIRPAWWVLRGLGVGMLLGVVFIDQFAWVTVLLVLTMVVVSVQWGRGRWLPPRGGEALGVALGLIALLGGMATASWIVWATNRAPSWELTAGTWVNGSPVGNIYAYSCDGDLLDAVQLFDQFGNPIDVYPYLTEPMLGDTAPNRAVDGELWNVFPLEDVAGAPSARVPELAECPLPDEER